LAILPMHPLALLAFCAAAGGLPKCFHSDFDKKLMGGRALRWILDNKSNIKAAPACRQSSNGLVERTWQTLVRMARSYITEKQVGREFWYWAVRHAAMMLNQVPGRLGRKLTTPFELVNNKKLDSKTWFKLFSIGYFPVESKAGEAASASQSHSLDGIAIGRDDKSNTILFYNPITKKYYSPSVFKLEQSHLPVMLYPKNICYDGGFVCGPLRNCTDFITEPFPPGTRVYIPKGDSKVKGTIQNVPLPFSNIGTSSFVASSDPDSDTKTTYTVLLDDGTTTEVPFEALIDPAERSLPTDTDLTSAYEGLPAFFSKGSKVTIDHNGSFHKGVKQKS
jgi:hypothetical protein